jgi:hypothetical protein
LHEGQIIAGRHIGIINHPALLASELERFLADGETVGDAQQNQESEIQ